MQKLLWLGALLWLTACTGAASTSDTMQATVNAYATQVLNVQANVATIEANAVQTLQTADLQLQQINNYNAILVATVRAGEVPTPVERAIASGVGAMSLDMLNTTDGVMRIMQVGVAGYIRPSDGCFESHQQYFNLSDTSVVYMTGLAVNLVAGTTFAVDWLYENEVVFQSGWTASMDETRWCFSVPMRSSDVSLQAGNWIARLFMNGELFTSYSFQLLN